MKKANTSRLPVGKKGLAALSLALINFLSVPAQSAEAIYSNFSAEDAHKIEVLTSSRVAETEKTAVFELG